MGFGSQVKYSKVSDVDEESSTALQIDAMDPPEGLSYDSYFTYNNDTDKKFEASNNFSSVFNYSNMGRSSGHLSINVREDAKLAEINASAALKFATHFITFMSYFFFLLTLPISYWFFVKKMGEFERLVVFRLGKLIGVKGPGRVVIFPWMDRTKK